MRDLFSQATSAPEALTWTSHATDLLDSPQIVHRFLVPSAS